MVFDTDCVLCSTGVGWLFRLERGPVLRFAGAWSPAGKALAEHYGFRQQDLHKTFLLVEQGRALTKSDAALRVIAHLRAPFSWFVVCRLIPRRLRDAAYSWLAANRYRLFGRRDSCFVAPPDQRYRILG